MTIRVFRAGALALCLLLPAAARGHAQALPPLPPPPAPPPLLQAPHPVTGFVPPYEIVKTVRHAGLDPLAPPLREGTTYVLRAINFRGILMRVVVDARTGVIRDVTRIVPGPGRYGQLGIAGRPYGLPPPYDPADFDAPGPMPMPVPGAGLEPPLLQSPAARPSVSTPAPLPLPRPRPAALAVRKPADGADAPGKAQRQRDPNSGANTGTDGAALPPGATGAKPEIKSEVITTAPPAAPPAAPVPPAAAPPPAPKTAPAVIPLND